MAWWGAEALATRSWSRARRWYPCLDFVGKVSLGGSGCASQLSCENDKVATDSQVMGQGRRHVVLCLFGVFYCVHLYVRGTATDDRGVEGGALSCDTQCAPLQHRRLM